MISRRKGSHRSSARVVSLISSMASSVPGRGFLTRRYPAAMAAKNVVTARVVCSGSSGMSATAAAACVTKNLLATITRETEMMARRSPADEEGKCSLAESGRASAPGRAAMIASVTLTTMRSTTRQTNSLTLGKGRFCSGELLLPFALPYFACEAARSVQPCSLFLFSGRGP